MSRRPPGSAPSAVVGVDIGGTFTDFVEVRNGVVRIHKVPTTPADPSDAFSRGLDDLSVPAGARYVHGSTVATNAVLERRGARAALLTTEGFRDVLELGRQTRLDLYSLSPTKHIPLIPRDRCFEVPERVDRQGEVLVALEDAELEAVLDRIQASGAESLAIVFLFSFVRPEHERRAGERAAARGLRVSLSSEILPEYREYERASTTAANAYVAPLMDRYLSRLDTRLQSRGRASLQIMQSNGGVISVDAARREAVRTVLSGPAGGVVGAWKTGALAGFPRLLTFDMGGTSTDVSLVDGVPTISAEGGTISHLPIRVPMLDIHTVGAGGGSLARLDEICGLRVGPESAGADPGPAAYGRGTEPTVTDANLLLGRLSPASFLGGRMRLAPERSRAALETVALRMGIAAEQLAEGVLEVANAQMVRALRRVSVERGYDPREFCLLAFGGGGPLHACELAEALEIPTVLIPRYPGILSALGMLLTDVRKEYSRTVMRPVEGTLADLAPLFDEMEARARRELLAEGVEPAAISLERWLDVRYRGQSYELPVPCAALEPSAVADSLREAHARRYSYAPESAPSEIVNLRLRAVGEVPQPELPSAEPEERAAPVPMGHQPVYSRGGWADCPVVDREALLTGHTVRGPALLVQQDTTTWLADGWLARVDPWYNLVVTRIAVDSRTRRRTVA